MCAVGRLRAGPERALVEDWLARFDRAGRPLGLGPASVHEVEAAGGPGPCPLIPDAARADPSAGG